MVSKDKWKQMSMGTSGNLKPVVTPAVQSSSVASSYDEDEVTEEPLPAIQNNSLTDA